MIRFLFRQGITRGLIGGNRFWTGVAVATGGIRIVSRLAGGKEKVLYSEKLEPGKTLVIARGTATDLLGNATLEG